jgi:phytoene dehydrogenase-like protein
MDSPEGGAYGVSRSVRQKFKTAALHRTPIGGLHAVGQSIFAPGILGTALGTLRVLAQIVGPSVLQKQFTDLKIEGI